MTTLGLVDAEQRNMVASFPDFDSEQDDLMAFRRDLVEGTTVLLNSRSVQYEERLVPGPDDAPDVRIILFHPPKSKRTTSAILYVHGGGMIAGTPDMQAGTLGRLASETGTMIVSVDYRLAPEAPFPGGLEDVYAALIWLHDCAEEMGIDPDRIMVMGDSGGGCLAAATALLARDRGTVKLHAQVLIYPMLDLRTGGANAPSDDPTTGEFVWTRAQNQHAWSAVRGKLAADDPRFGYLSPAFMHDLSGLPATFIITGALDLFRDEDITFAHRLWKAGVPTELIVYANAVHAFDLLPSSLGERVRHDVLEAVRRLL
ncbi:MULTISPECIES: alpha/beta hydrolase [Acetobacter]|uniref:Lipase 2 n=1 Tax=Acetobacter pomorum DM001 TaxID=945681 RepID=F1YRF3_9PROT|nr:MULTISPECIES: alpha/beta hydrolase [Acetobacter]ATI11102.1 alpha/beta hydrolase [Acetobacter pomorum]AXC26557.1 alpha/beta hydrolase [Acetobacter sp. JWB]EGE48638.1 Lipase 2 [Acetobacter pomorum DM001]KAA8423262.1 alpha/beta hydrolase [Acetobacter pomorum]KAA8435708.1 alpha/beta hydrolase [Acetobacter pomorum]